MRILDDEQERPVHAIWLYMTRAEARDLADGILVGLSERDPDWHMHASDLGGDAFQLSVAIYDPDAMPSEPRLRRFLKDGTFDSS